MKSPDWSSTAVIINYDDSDGWYDHVFSGVHNPSTSQADNLTNTTFSGPTSGMCDSANPIRQPLDDEQGRCGFGPRLPMLVISPYAKSNYVDHNLSDQASIINFVEYNWHLPGIPGSADQILARRDRRHGLRVRPRRDVRLQRPGEREADPQPEYRPALDGLALNGRESGLLSPLSSAGRAPPDCIRAPGLTCLCLVGKTLPAPGGTE